MKQSKLIKFFIENLGGEENILSIYNCVSRLRIDVKDPEKINLDNLLKMQYVEKAFISGQTVQILFSDRKHEWFLKQFQEATGYNDGVFALKQVVTGKRSIIERIVEVFSGVATPLLFVLGSYGIITMFDSIINTQWVQGNANSSLTGSVDFFQQLHNVLNVLTTAMGLIVTMGIPWAVFRYTKQNQVFGLGLGLILVLSSKVGTIGISDLNQLNLTDDWSHLNVFDKLYWTWYYGDPTAAIPGAGNWAYKIVDGVNVQYHTTVYTLNWFGNGSFGYMLSYDGNMIGVILVSAIAVWILKGSDKIFKNEIASNILKGPFMFVSVFLISFLFVGPVTFIVTDYISMGVTQGFANPYAKWFVWAIIGLTGPYLVLFSLDSFILVIGFLQFYTPGIIEGSSTGPLVAVIIYMGNGTAITTATLTYIVQHRDIKELKNSAVNFGMLGYVAGVTSPMLYKVNSKLPHTMYASCIGSLSAALVACATGITGNWGTGSILGILSIEGQSTMKGVTTLSPNGMSLGMVWGSLMCVVCIGVTILCTWGFGKINYFKNKSDKVIAREWS